MREEEGTGRREGGLGVGRNELTQTRDHDV